MLLAGNSGPSEKAIEVAAAHATIERWRSYPDHVRAGLVAAHDPALGLDRSVCLRDVVEAFRAAQASWIDPGMSIEAKALAMENMGALAAAFLERKFGGKG